MGRKIYLDVGHGESGSDSGASAVSGPTKYYENDRNLKIAMACRDKLVENGFIVVMSREKNENIGGIVGNYNRADSNLINSATKANTGSYDAMISIHCNDSDNTSTRGYWLCHKNDNISETLAKNIADKFDNEYKPHQHKMIRNDVSTNYTRYGILRLHGRPGVLVECGFMSNAQDIHEILCNAKEIGETIAKGIIDTFYDEKTAMIDEIIKDLAAVQKKLENFKKM